MIIMVATVAEKGNGRKWNFCHGGRAGLGVRKRGEMGVLWEENGRRAYDGSERVSACFEGPRHGVGRV